MECYYCSGAGYAGSAAVRQLLVNGKYRGVCNAHLPAKSFPEPRQGYAEAPLPPVEESRGPLLDAADKWYAERARQPQTEKPKEKEKEMPRKLVDDDRLVELHKQGLSDRQIAERMDISSVAVSSHRRTLGLTLNGGEKSQSAAKPAAAIEPRAPRKPRKPRKTVEALAVQPAPGDSPVVDPTLARIEPAANGRHAKARVVMFEIEGGDATIMAAIETVKAALAR